MSKLFGDAGPTTQDLARLAEDKKAQGLSGARIVRLALALELGRAHHTFRRTADRMARDAMAETGASKEDIDDLFGWLQAQRAKDQQKAYAGIAERSVRARCTMMI